MNQETYPIEQSDSVANLFCALVEVQPILVMPEKDSDNPFFKSKYAELDACIDANREILGKAGLAVVQPPTGSGANVAVTTILAHRSGEWLRSTCDASAKAGDPQAVGSGITYLRRYAYLAILGIAPKDEDDDGNNSSKHRMVIAFETVGVTEAMLVKKIGKPLAKMTEKDDEELAKIFGFLKSGDKVEKHFPPSPADQANKKYGSKTA